MSGLTTGVEFLFALVLMLGVLITVHEFGHFVAASGCSSSPSASGRPSASGASA
jgi:hypothetical protein